MSVVSIVIMLYCVFNGTKILNIFNPQVSPLAMRCSAGLIVLMVVGRRGDDELQHLFQSHGRAHLGASRQCTSGHHPAARQRAAVSLHDAALCTVHAVMEWIFCSCRQLLITARYGGDAYRGGGDSAGADAGTGGVPADKSSGTPQERAFFHLLLMLLACYGAMILSNWGQTNGAPASAGSGKASSESLWLKIVSQWVFLLFYAKILHVQYLNHQEA